MNRIIRSRLSAIAVVLLIPIILLGCTPEECMETVFGVCTIGCSLPCSLTSIFDPYLPFWCTVMCGLMCVGELIDSCPSLQACTENPDECVATFEQIQSTAIQFCDQYPEQCQEYFDAWVESLDNETEE